MKNISNHSIAAKKAGVGKWMKGRKLSEETKIKIGLAGKGRTYSEETKKVMSKNKLGDKNPMFGKIPKAAFKKGCIPWNKEKTGYTTSRKGGKAPWVTGSLCPLWKGGITPEDKMLRTRFRISIVPIVLKRDDYTCQICFIRGIELHVDHIKKWSDYPKLRFDLDNCRTLCKGCHYLVTFGKLLLDKNTLWGKHKYA